MANERRQIIKYFHLIIHLLACLLPLLINGQFLDDAISTTIPECLNLPGHYFCNPKNASTNPNKPQYEGFGWCCPALSTSANCQKDYDDLSCTSGDSTVQGVPIYKTYWVGMTAAVCNQTETGQILRADSNLQHAYASKFVIEERDSEAYEACYWQIAVEEDKYRDDTSAYIELSLEVYDNVEVFIYDGSGRDNATEFI